MTVDNKESKDDDCEQSVECSTSFEGPGAECAQHSLVSSTGQFFAACASCIVPSGARFSTVQITVYCVSKSSQGECAVRKTSFGPWTQRWK